LTASRAQPLVIIAAGFARAVVVGVAAQTFGAAPDTSVSFAGVSLDVLGLGTVATGLHQLRRKFTEPGVLTQAYAAVLEQLNRPRARSRNTVLHAEAVDGASVVEDAELTVKAAPGVPIERRVELLEGDLKRLREHDLPEVYAGLAQADDALARERTERTGADAAIAEAVRDVAAGGLYLQTVGLYWLVGGALLGTIPGPIATPIGAILKLAGLHVSHGRAR
jgi:hypothetical protein